MKRTILKTMLILLTLLILISTTAYADKTINNEEDIYISGGAIVEEGIDSDKTFESSRLKRYELHLIIFLIINMIFVTTFVFFLNKHLNKIKLGILGLKNEFDDKEEIDKLNESLEKIDKLRNKNKERIFEHLIFCVFIYILYYFLVFHLF